MKNLIFLGVVSAFMFLASCAKDSNSVLPTGAVTGTTTTTTVTTVVPPAGGPAGVLGDTLPPGSLPDSVRNYILTNFPGATITVVEVETRNGVTTYEVEILVGGVRKELYFSATWVFLNVRIGHTGGNGSNHGNSGGHGRDSIYNVVIPANIIAQIHATYPNDTIIIGKRERENGVITYEVIIKNGSTVRFLTYDANWVFIGINNGDGEHRDDHGNGGGNGGNGGNNDDMVIAISTIPASATAYISTTYAGYTITKAKKETERGIVTYEVQITSGTTKKWLVFSAAWVFLREEH